MMGYTHFDKVSTVGGYAIGKKGNEVPTILSSGMAAIVPFTLSVPIEDLDAGTSIATRPVYVTPAGYSFVVNAVNIISQGSATGIGDSDTCKIDVLNGTDVLATKTYNDTVTFPAVTAAGELTVTAAKATVAPGTLIKVSVTSGTDANPPAFILQLNGALKVSST